MPGFPKGPTMTHEELLKLPVTVPVLEAGRAFDLSPDGVYDLIRRDAFPCRVIRVGRTYRVPRAELLRVLGIDAAPAGPAPACTCEVQAAGTRREARILDRGCPRHGDREPAFPGAPVRGDSVRGPGAQAG
jgi:hypothetical protein